MQCHVHLTQGLADEWQERNFFFIFFEAKQNSSKVILTVCASQKQNTEETDRLTKNIDGGRIVASVELRVFVVVVVFVLAVVLVVVVVVVVVVIVVVY